MKLQGESELLAMAQRQDQMQAGVNARKVQQFQQVLQGYQGYLNTCNALIQLVNDIIATDTISDEKKEALLKRQSQAQQDAAFARDNIFSMLDDMLDRRPPPYAPNIQLV